MYRNLAPDEVALTFFTFFLIRTDGGRTNIAVYRGSALPKKTLKHWHYKNDLYSSWKCLGFGHLHGWGDITNAAEERKGRWKERCQKLVTDIGEIDKTFFLIKMN
jgi:hypothetical protein